MRCFSAVRRPWSAVNEAVHLPPATWINDFSPGETRGAVPYNEGLAVLVQEQSYDQETPDLPNAVLYHTTPSGTRTGKLFERTDAFLLSNRSSVHRTRAFC
ncbi:MAG: hypothetical protein BRD30_08410 [Bacteroidetes bacterium QH_2_63_10]|nr:MAG: hypothetical protein BRD30_08410 [Bacteroidetes bacterium QH_2_63_10]